MRTLSRCKRVAQVQSKPWDLIPTLSEPACGSPHSQAHPGSHPRPSKPQEATVAWQGHWAGTREQEVPRAFWSLRGRLCCLGREWNQQELGERGSCYTKPSLNRNQSLLPGAGPGARLASQHAQRSCSPAPTESQALPTSSELREASWGWGPPLPPPSVRIGASQ